MQRTDSRAAGQARPLPLTAYVTCFVAMFFVAAGAGLSALAAVGQLSGGLLALTLAGLVAFAAACVVFYLRLVRPLLALSTGVRDITVDPSAGPLAVSGPEEVASLVRDINTLIGRIRADAQAKARLAAIVESSADAIIGKTLDGIITEWNHGAEEQYGYRAGEMIGRSVAALIPPDRAGELPAILARVRRGERINHMVTKRRCKDGTLLDVSLSVSPIRDPDGTVTGAATVARNISDRIQVAAERREMERRLHQAARLESLGQLAGGIAHDFNNLLAIVMNYTGFAQEAVADPATLDDLRQVQDAAERAARITRQLLIVGGRDTPQPEVLGLNEIVNDTLELLATAVGAAVEIRVHTAADLPAIEADRGQVEQVLLNLTVNARDAMTGHGTLTIETRRAVCAGEAQVELAVTDTGRGMSPDVAEHIFDPFFTTKPTGRGTGLGLATVHTIVTRLGGSIGVESREGTGTTFRILLPAAAAAPAAPGGAPPAARGRGQTVLVVDDEPPVLALTSRILRQHGYATLEAGSYTEALSLAASQDLHLLLTDSVMPQMSGPTLAEHIASMKPGLPVLYMSGNTTEALSQRIAADPTVYIQKPFSPQALLDKVDTILSREAAVADGDR